MEILVGILTMAVFGLLAGILVLAVRTHKLAQGLTAMSVIVRQLADNAALAARLMGRQQQVLDTDVVLKKDLLNELN